MATIDIWIQLENRPWDACPWLPQNRMTSAGTLPVGPLRLATLRSPTGAVRQVSVHRPLPGDALILRRYTANWAKPDDRKVNPWDLNEPDPTDAGTMGTIPGPTLECNVGDTVRVHFRNFDQRTLPAAPWERGAELPPAKRTHSLHAHGFTFPSKYDGAYPLSPPDPDQPIPPAERAAWNALGVTGSFKQGDRVPPFCSFTYTWEARGAASAGVWIYHDHSICDENTARGALGFVVVHNPADKLNEVVITPERLPGGSWTGSPLVRKSQPFAGAIVGVHEGLVTRDGFSLHEEVEPKPAPRFGKAAIAFEVSPATGFITALSLGTYRAPPDQALYLLLFHELDGVGMCINGRQYLGNAPTLVAGAKTRMRFGVAGLGEAFHTFHIHGHRWVVPGPSGKTPTAIEQSTQTEPVSQFEDTKVFGPGSSFAFTLEEGTGLFRADPPFGEWHLHCHVPMHMMHGMAGSLLVVAGGELAFPLPEGQGCPPDPVTEPPRAAKTFDVEITDHGYKPNRVYVIPGDSVRFTNNGRKSHDVVALDHSWTTNWLYAGQSATVPFHKLGEHPYTCSLETGNHRAEDNHRHNAGETLRPAVVVLEHDIGISGGGAGGSAAPATPGPAPGGAAVGSVRDVSIDATGFHPSSLLIKAGDSVRWTNHDTTPHTASADDHAWSSPTLPGGKSYAQTFSSKGTIAYHCHLHHEMTASIQVT